MITMKVNNSNKKMNGKRLTKWIGMAALTLGALGLLAGPLYAEKDEKETVVTWTIEGCAIELDAPNAIQLGTAAPGDVLTSQPNQGEVKVTSSCDYTVTISLDGFTKDAQNVSGNLLNTLLTQYSFRVESVNPGSKVENLQPNYTTFGSVGDVKSVCKSKDGAEAPHKDYKCRLQFQVDTTLLPAGEYAAYHTVTASTP